MDDDAPTDPAAYQPPLSRGSQVAKALGWTGIIWLIGWLGMIAEQSISWTDTWMGAMNGALIGAFISPFLLIITIPLGLVGLGVGSWRPLRKWRILLSLALPALFSCWGIVGRIVDRFQPERRFTSMTGVRFPDGAKILSAQFRGGLVADYNYTYVFTCPKEETTRLIRDLKLTKQESGSTSLGWSSGAGSRISPGEWTVEEVWSFSGFSTDPGKREKAGRADFIELQTEATQTKVRLICGTI